MRRVGPGRLTLAAACLVWVLFLVSTLGGVWMILTGRMTADPSVMAVVGFAPGRERVAEISCWLGVAVCAAFTVYFAWRTFYLGTGYLLYDEEWWCSCSAAWSAVLSAGGTWRFTAWRCGTWGRSSRR